VEDPIVHTAIRRLTIDIANLTGQLALLQAAAEYIHLVADGIDPDSWDRRMDEDADGIPEMTVIVRGDQADTVLRLLTALNSLG